MAPNQLRENRKEMTWMNNQIRPGLREGVDFLLVTEPVIKKLLAKFNTEENYRHFMRVATEQDDGEVVCELQLRRVRFMAVPNKKLFKMKEPWFVYAPKSMSIPDLEKKLKAAINFYLISVVKDKSTMFTAIKLWILKDFSLELVEKYDDKHRNYTSSAIDALPLYTKESEAKTMVVDDINFTDDDVFLLETPKNKDFVFTPLNSDEERKDDEDAKPVAKNPPAGCVYNEAVVTLEELNQVPLRELVPKGTNGGLCGLNNLGNTCFMNSGL